MIRAAHLRSYLREDALPSYEAQPLVAPGPLRGDDFFLWRETDTDDAFTVDWGSGRYVCPRNFRLRRLEGMLAFNNAFPDAGLIPQTHILDASAQLEALRDDSPAMRSYILTSPWHVPVRWFAAFLHEEREVYDRPEGLSIRYRALLSDAQDRVERATQVVASAGFDPTVVGQIRSLSSWLEAFPGDGMLELDYGSVADLFSEGDLVLDESAADVASSLLALEQEDLDRAGEHYANLMRRWSHAQSLAFSS
ncbi:MAG: hypothetical protein QNJ81_10265 [Acidimicrobiia bacterium]|nr:hypothetical protein [Acidimicrobiia bacterium]